MRNRFKFTASLAILVVAIFAVAGMAGAQSSPASQPVASSDAASLVKDKVLAKSGVCLLIGKGHAQLAVDAVRNGTGQVVVLAPDETECKVVRDALDAAGVYGTRAVAMVGSCAAIPMPEYYCNTIVVPQALDEAGIAEVKRVLSPNGKAVVAGKVISGVFPKSYDDWGYHRHDPSNNAVSSEDDIAPPFRTQWIAGQPAWASGDMVSLVARGRTIIMSREKEGTKQTLFVKDAFNGMPLWERTVDSPEGSAYRKIAMGGDSVYLIDGGKNILVLDAATGAETRKYTVPDGIDPKAGWERIVIVGDTFYVHATLSDSEKQTRRGKTSDGGVFFAMNKDNGKLLWKYDYKGDVPERTVSIGDGALFFYDAKKGAVSIDIKTGKELWVNAEAVTVLKNGGRGGTPTGDASSVFYNDKVVFYGQEQALALNPKTGAQLWSTDANKGRAMLFAGDGKAYMLNGWSKYFTIVDEASGKCVTTKTADLPGCGSGTATGKTLYSGGAYFGAYDLENDKPYYDSMAFRSTCATGSVPSNGLLSIMPHSCSCNIDVNGPLALTPAGKWKIPAWDKDIAARFVKGPAFDKPLAKTDPKTEWPNYRYDAKHSATTSGDVAVPKTIKWKAKLAKTLTAPTVGGGLVYVGGDDGHVWALKPSDGTQAWCFRTGACVAVAPTFWQGRLFIASDDGWVYCVDAATGELAWKFRGAPEERYLQIDGRIVSTWPARSGVVVEDGTAYFAAGMVYHDGAYLYSVDAKTGKIVWAKQVGQLDDKERGVNPRGPMALADGRVYLSSGGRPSCYKTSDGSVLWWHIDMHIRPTGDDNIKLSRFEWSGGSEMMIDGDIIIYGGPRLIGWGAYPFLLCGVNDAYPYKTIEAIKTGKAVLEVPKGADPAVEKKRNIAEFFPDPEGPNRTPVLTADVVYWPQSGSVKAYDRKKLANVHLVGKANQPKAEQDATIWKADAPADAHTLAVAGHKVLGAGPSKRTVLSKAEGRVLGSVTVPGSTIRNGLAVAGGAIYIVTEDGTICCTGD